LVGFCSRVNVALCEAQRRAGADSSTIGLAGTSLISPKLFDIFELPGARAFCSAMQRVGGFAFVHACGNETHLLENLLATGADCLELDPCTDAGTCKRTVQGRAAVLGMIDPAHVMRFGTPDDVRRHALEMLKIMAPGGGFIAGPGCALPADTPVENVLALMECVRRHGTYRADGSLESVLE
jgi:uroporphyrinogen decarboxylase